jgi:hypothetical protein
MRIKTTEKRQRKENNIVVILYLSSLLFGFMLAPAFGQMEAMSDAAMDAVTAQSGVSVVIVDYQFDWAAGYLTLYDSDYDATVDPDDGVLSFTGMTLLGGIVGTNETITWDAYTIDDASHPMDGQTFTLWQSPDLYQHLNLTVDDVVFCGQSIGQLAVDNFTTPEQYCTLGAHGSGMDFQYDLQMHMNRFGYTFNTSGTDDTFELSGIHLAGAFEDMADFDITDSTTWDIPTDPSEWTYTGVFSIGDIDGGIPATLDIGTDASGQTVMQIELPMNGSLRVESLNFGAKDFGPMAIDGLEVHRLTVTIPGSI